MRYTVPAAIISALAGLIMCILVCRLMFPA